MVAGYESLTNAQLAEREQAYLQATRTEAYQRARGNVKSAIAADSQKNLRLIRQEQQNRALQQQVESGRITQAQAQQFANVQAENVRQQSRPISSRVVESQQRQAIQPFNASQPSVRQQVREGVRSTGQRETQLRRPVQSRLPGSVTSGQSVIRRPKQIATGRAEVRKPVLANPQEVLADELQSKKIKKPAIQTEANELDTFARDARETFNLDISNIFNLSPQDLREAPAQTYLNRAIKGAGNLFISPIKGVAKLLFAGEKEFFKNNPLTPNLNEKAVSESRTEKVLASQPIFKTKYLPDVLTDPDVIATGTVATLGVVGTISPVLGKIGVVGISGFQGYETFKNPTPENVGAFAIVGVSGVVSAGGLFRNVKLRATGEYVPPERVFDPKVLSGEKVFPETTSPQASLKAFRTAPKQDGKIQVIHATGTQLPKQTSVQPGEFALKGKEDPGLFVTPVNRASPHFLRLSSPAQEGVRVELDPFGFNRPQLIQVGVKQVRRQPESVLKKPGFGTTQEFLISKAGSGEAFITKRSEAAFRNLGVSGSKELEAVIPVGSVLKEVPRSKPRYTTFRGEAVPIRQFEIQKGKVDKSAFESFRKQSESARKGIESLRSSKIRISPSYSIRRTPASSQVSSSVSSPSKSVSSVPSTPSKPIRSLPSTPSRPSSSVVSKPSRPASSRLSKSLSPVPSKSVSRPSGGSSPINSNFITSTPGRRLLRSGGGGDGFGLNRNSKVGERYGPSLGGQVFRVRIKRVPKKGTTFTGFETRGVPINRRTKISSLSKIFIRGGF